MSTQYEHQSQTLNIKFMSNDLPLPCKLQPTYVSFFFYEKVKRKYQWKEKDKKNKTRNV